MKDLENKVHNSLDNDAIDEIISSIDFKLQELEVELDQIVPSNIGLAIQKYIAIRDRMSQTRKLFSNFEDTCKSRQNVLNAYLVSKGDELGTTSFKTDYGTAFKQVKESYRVSDWDEFSNWVLETKNLQCVEKRAAKHAVKEILEETSELPPGLSIHAEVEYAFRR